MWTMPEPKEIIRRSTIEVEKMNLVSSDCTPKSVSTLHFYFSVLEARLMLKSVNLFSYDTDWRCKRRTWRGSKKARCYTVSGPDVSVC
jgi:hypothetical protein